MSDFIDVESKLRLHMLVLTLGIITTGHISRQVSELDGHGPIRCQGMTTESPM